MAKETESCGRCSMTSVVGAVDADDGGEPAERDPFGEARIEVPEGELRTASAPLVLAGRVRRKLDEFATTLTYGR